MIDATALKHRRSAGRCDPRELKRVQRSAGADRDQGVTTGTLRLKYWHIDYLRSSEDVLVERSQTIDVAGENAMLLTPVSPLVRVPKRPGPAKRAMNQKADPLRSLVAPIRRTGKRNK